MPWLTKVNVFPPLHHKESGTPFPWNGNWMMGTKSAVTSAYVTRPKRANRFAIREKKSYELHPTY